MECIIKSLLSADERRRSQDPFEESVLNVVAPREFQVSREARRGAIL